MTYAHLDDSFGDHPKTEKVGNAAAGLFARCVSYCSRQLTDGVVPAEVVARYGTAPQLRKLLAVGFVHQGGHACPRCVQPDGADIVLHDYLKHNKSRSQVTAERARAAARKRAERERWGADRDGAEGFPRSDRGFFDVDPIADRDGFDVESSSNRIGKKDDSAGDAVVSRWDSRETRARASSTPLQVSPTERPLAGSCAPVPPSCQPLVRAMTAAGLVVRWGLDAQQWEQVDHHIRRCGVPVLVDAARLTFSRARRQPRSAQYFARCWAELPDVPPEATLIWPPQSATDTALSRGADLMARMARLDEAEAMGQSTSLDLLRAAR